MSSFLCVIFWFWVPHLNDITWYLSDLLNRMSSRSVHVVTNGKISFFFMAEYYCCCFSVTLSCLTVCDPMDCSTPGLPVPPIVCPSSCSLHQWCRPAISSSDALCFFCPQSFPASGTFSMSRLFTSDDQNTGASALASVLPVNIQSWLKEEMANHPIYLLWEPHELYKRLSIIPL